jgi:hypothetical protein
MSHDQRPGKVRVVGRRPIAPQPVSTSKPGSGTSAPGSTGKTARGKASAAAAAARVGRRWQLLLSAIFVVACAVGGALLPLTHLI